MRYLPLLRLPSRSPNIVSVPVTDDGLSLVNQIGGGTAPAFTGSPTSVVQPYLVVYFWERTA